MDLVILEVIILSGIKKKKYENVIFFDDIVVARIKSEERKKIVKVVNKNQDVFESDSHFVRCCIIRSLRDFDRNGRRLN